MKAAENAVPRSASAASDEATPSSVPWHLRPALPEDTPALQRHCLADRTLEDVERLLRHSQKTALNRRGLGLVAELPDGTPIGFGQLTLWPNTAEISDLIVGKRWRGQGVGSAIIRKLIEAAREMAMDRVEIGVALRNYDTLRLYRRLGFDYGRTIDLDLGEGPEPVMYMEMALTPQRP